MSMPKFQMHEIVIYNNPLNPLHIHIHLHLHLQGNIPNSGHYIDASRTVTLSRQGLEDPLVIDVRDPNEVAEGKGGPPSAIPGSVGRLEQTAKLEVVVLVIFQVGLCNVNKQRTW